jgi:hypothetical protein
MALMSRGVYTGTLSWLIYPTSNYSPDSATNGACVESYVNSSFTGLSVGVIAFAYSAVTFVTDMMVFAYSAVAFVNGAVMLFACNAVVFIYRQWRSR